MAENNATLPVHELLWLSCAAKRCCSLRTVLPTGGDIWRIATQLDVPPESFLRTVPAPADAVDGVLIDPQLPPVQLALARRPGKGRQAPCIFLVPVTEDLARCGLGQLRPLVCQAFPGALDGGVVGIADPGCSCRGWTIADLDRPTVAALLAQDAAEREIDRRVVRAWNEQLVANGAPASLGAFCRYLMRAYAAAAAGAPV